MYDIHRRDRQVFLQELLRFGPLFLTFVVLLVCSLWHSFTPLFFGSILLAWAIAAAYRRSVLKRFYSNKFLMLWQACKDRLNRFHDALDEGKRRGVPELHDLPKTVDQVGETLYSALRRADVVMREVSTSEGWLVLNRFQQGPISPDQKAQELYRLADKNIAEYKQHYQAVMSGVERTEAQAVVFTTTLDTLRLRMLGHRLAGRSPELEHTDFLQALTEARMQLDSIDKALDELELTPFPGGSSPPSLDSLMSDEMRELLSEPPPVPQEAPKRDGQD